MISALWFLLDNWIVGFIGSFLIAGIAYDRRSLSKSGVLAAIAVGTILYALGNLAWFGTLLVFFITSTLASKLKPHRKRAAEHLYAKGANRDAFQVLANGGAGLIACIGNAIWPNPLWWWLFLGAMSTVNADTWATEIGGMSTSPPISVASFRTVPAGTSGGISRLGLIASIAGGLCIGVFAAFFIPFAGNSATDSLSDPSIHWISLLVISTCAGLIGSLADSWLGAYWQVMYRCAACRQEIEKPMHCAHQASLIRGYAWMNNDTVNFISSCVGSIVAVALSLIFA